ncbi:MAG: hypothetical protein Q7S22_08360 [Candidatus Micrarchaeota archaeon]|nr:hypothetical protein [Candidatus Micrarchaeota archaeon]
MANERNGRILDKGFEEGITNKAGEFQKEVQDDINKAQKYAYRKNDEFGAMVNEHPKSFVLGAFLGGVALGTLLSKGSK